MNQILIEIGISCARGEGMRRPTLGSGGHRRPKLDLEAWQRHHSFIIPLGQVGFLIIIEQQHSVIKGQLHLRYLNHHFTKYQ